MGPSAYRYLQSLVVCLHGCALVEIEGKARRTSARTAPVSTGDTIGLIFVSLSDTHAPIQLGGPHDLELQGSPDGTGLRRRRGQRLPADVLRAVRRKLRKLRMIHRVTVLDDLRVPPANRLESLKGDRAGQHAPSA